MNNNAILKRLDQRFSLNKNASKILVVGLGKTGLSVAYYLRQLGFSFAIVDSRKKPPNNDQLLAEMPDVAVFTGGFDTTVFAVATHLIVSPGVAMDEPHIIQAIAQGSCPLSDIDLFACAVSQPIVAITGSNGKSTVTTMVGAMIKMSGKNVAVGGNLGTPALDLIAEEIEIYVLELSSFQLERTSQLNAAVATVLNISADHMDRYEGLDAYIEEKNKVYSGSGVKVVNLDCPYAVSRKNDGREMITFGMRKKADYTVANAQLIFRGRALLPVSELLVTGVHNQVNALAALALGQSIGLSESVMCDALRRYKGLKHRVEWIASIKGVNWINDSKATNVGACIAALQGFDNASVVLIAGGDAKGADMSDLTPVLREKVKMLLLVGKDGALIKQSIDDDISVLQVNTVKKAVKKAVTIAKSGDTVLLSPACASLDQFSSYQERGNVYAAEVMRLVG